MKKTKSKFAFAAGGDTPIEKAFALFRHHCSIIADRVQTLERCRHCFTHGWTRGGRWGIRVGCDGCAEMHEFIDSARALFAREDNNERIEK